VVFRHKAAERKRNCSRSGARVLPSARSESFDCSKAASKADLLEKVSKVWSEERAQFDQMALDLG
jgi:hypothetical protein